MVYYWNLIACYLTFLDRERVSDRQLYSILVRRRYKIQYMSSTCYIYLSIKKYEKTFCTIDNLYIGFSSCLTDMIASIFQRLSSDRNASE
jgi:hypothetical protein